MSTVTFHPARLNGSAPVPPAKSEAHRALLLAALGKNACRLEGFFPPLCDDTLAMIDGIRALGADVTMESNALLVTPAPEPSPGAPMVQCNVNACAAALRMLIPVFLARGQAVRFSMTEGLFNRPLDALEPLIQRANGYMERCAATPGQPYTVTVKGRLPAGEYRIDGSQSSQFASGLLIALLHGQNAQGRPAKSFLTLSGEIVSRPYLDMTLDMMRRFRTDVSEQEEGEFTINPRRENSPERVSVGGDWSQAAVLLCADAMGSAVTVQNLSDAETSCVQGDRKIADVLRSMGMRVERKKGGLRAICPSRAELSPLEVDCSPIPDIAPILALTCTQAKGVSVLRGVKRLAIKESDRLQGTLELLRLLGATAEIGDNGDTLTVAGPTILRGGFEADALGDHRRVMFLAVAALKADQPITVHGAQALNKSWPGFLDDYQALGGKIS